MMTRKNQNNNIYIILMVSSLFTYIGILLMGDFRTNILSYFVIILPAYFMYFYLIIYILKVKECNQKFFFAIIITGFLARLLLIPSDPVLSDDVYRYLWDGKVIAHGINPFKYAPNAAELSYLRDTKIYPYINFPDIPTVYPPAAQLFFYIGYMLGYKIILWKVMVLFIECVSVYFLIKLLDYFSINRMRLIIYLLNPLVIIETYGSGHLDVIGICLFMIAVYYFYKNNNKAALLTFLMSVLVKYLPFLMIIPFLFRSFWKKIFLFSGCLFIILLAFSLNGVIPTSGFVSYLNRWEFNGALYKLFVTIFNFIGIQATKLGSVSYSGRQEIFYLNSAFYYKTISILVLLVITYSQYHKLKLTVRFKGLNYFQASFFIGAAILLLTPTLYPWYLIWLLPFLVIIPNFSWLLFTFLVQLSYYVLQNYSVNNVWRESLWILLIEYIPFYILLIAEYLDQRRIKGWFL